MISLRKRRLRVTLGPLRIVSVVLGLAIGTVGYAADPVPDGPVAAPLLVPARPYWPELTVAQRQALAPLSSDWERLDLQTKKKWVEIAKRYPKMQPDEQARTSERMREWALLTPEQRRVARDSFARIRAMPPEQRAEMLRKYQELTPERRQALATEGRASKALVVPKPMQAPVPQRTQIREGATVRNPAVAAQKSASPIVAPAHASAPKPPPAAQPAAMPPAVAPATPAALPAGTPAS